MGRENKATKLFTASTKSFSTSRGKPLKVNIIRVWKFGSLKIKVVVGSHSLAQAAEHDEFVFKISVSPR